MRFCLWLVYIWLAVYALWLIVAFAFESVAYAPWSVELWLVAYIIVICLLLAAPGLFCLANGLLCMACGLWLVAYDVDIDGTELIK